MCVESHAVSVLLRKGAVESPKARDSDGRIEAALTARGSGCKRMMPVNASINKFIDSYRKNTGLNLKGQCHEIFDFWFFS